ncbi:MAG: hypothetical protein ACRC1R_05135 [Cetobacterium sp.]|uniref:hypothetical protein n=1 Tax=Cetobacterium sp. TaxID=2071632 RepID=UPI003F3B950C
MAKKKIFKAGDYGNKGKYTVDDFKNWIGQEFSFPITIGHIGDYIKNKVPITAIPKAGIAKCLEIDTDGYLIADVEYNEFGKDITKIGAYDNYSLGIDATGNPNHLALLGFALPHIDDLDTAYMEFSSEIKPDEFQYIEFSKGGTMSLDEIFKALEELSAEDKLTLVLTALKNIDVTQVDISPILTKAWELDDQQWYVNKLVGEGYTVVKASEFTKADVDNFAKTLGFRLVQNEEPKTLTKEEWEAKYAAEFSRKQEENQYKDRFIKLFPPVMQKFAEFCATEAYKEGNYSNLIEFSADKKTSMAEFIKESVDNGGPFNHLFKSLIGSEFNKDNIIEQDPYELGLKIAKL